MTNETRWLDIGKTEYDGVRFLLPAPGHGFIHGLISGTTGSGKSNTCQNVIGELAHLEGIAFAGIDFKEGLEQWPWSARFTDIAFQPRPAAVLLARIQNLMEARGEWMRPQGIRDWSNEYGPRLVLWIDELASMVRRRKVQMSDEKGDVFDLLEALNDIAERGRALGIHILASTQYGLAKDLGSGLLLNLDFRIVHRMKTPLQYATSLGFDQGQLTIDPITTNPNDRGVCYVTGVPGLRDLTRCKPDLVQDSAIDAWAARTRHLRIPPEQLWVSGGVLAASAA